MSPSVSQTPYMSAGLYGRSMPMGMGMSAYGMGGPQMGMEMGKGKGKEIDFDAAFAQFTGSYPGQSEGARITEVDGEEVERLADALQEANLGKQDEEGNPYQGTDFEECVDVISGRAEPLTLISVYSGYGISCRTRSCLRRPRKWRSGRRSSTR